MVKHFKAHRSKGFGTFLLVACLIVVFLSCILPYLYYGKLLPVNYLIIFLIALPVIVIFSWIWSSTYYLIEDDMLRINHGPFRLSVPVADVLEIRLNQKTPGILKASLSFDCIMIKYGRYKSVYISPEKSDSFIKTMREINSDIVVRNS